MENVLDFMSAAWSWIVMGLLLAIYFVLFKMIDVKRKKSGTKDYKTEGSILGMGLGKVLGSALQINVGIAIMIGMIIGLYLGSKKERKEKNDDDENLTITENQE